MKEGAGGGGKGGEVELKKLRSKSPTSIGLSNFHQILILV